MTSLYFKFDTKIKHPEEFADYQKHHTPTFAPKKFDVVANKQEHHNIQALINELNQNNNHDALIECLPIGLTKNSRHMMLMDIYGLHISTSKIQAIIKKHYNIVSEGKTPTVKLNDKKSEFQIEITA